MAHYAEVGVVVALLACIHLWRLVRSLDDPNGVVRYARSLAVVLGLVAGVVWPLTLMAVVVSWPARRRNAQGSPTDAN